MYPFQQKAVLHFHLSSTTLRTAQKPGSWVSSRPSRGIMCSQLHTDTSFHPTPNAYLQRCAHTHRRTQRLVCPEEYAHGTGQHGLYSKIPASSNKQRGRIRGSHGYTPEHDTQMSTHLHRHTTQMSTCPYSAQFQPSGLKCSLLGSGFLFSQKREVKPVSHCQGSFQHEVSR